MQSTVFIVDDDEPVRHLLSVICTMAGLPCETFPDGPSFVRAYRPNRPGCLVVDVRMPGMSGIEVQQWVAAQEVPLPVIVITGHGDVPMAVTAFRGGAWDFLEKPFDDEYFLQRVQEALERDREARAKWDARNSAAARFRRLSKRERAVMELMVKGFANKIIAAELDIGIRTVESHRARVLKKMGVMSLSELTRLHLCLKNEDG